MKHETPAPAPWFLTGSGVVLLYRFPAGFNSNYGFMDAYQQDGLLGGIGAVMLMDYRTSDVGPYRELLYIPALFKLGGKLSFSISKIYVSTEESVWNGRRNWGIPKDLARFSIRRQADGSQSWEVAGEDGVFFEAAIKPFGPLFPFWTRLLPVFRIVQESPDGLLLTRPVANGKAKLASLQEIRTNPCGFPPVDNLEPLTVCSLSEFEMTFPLARNLSV